ncbi:hypothetical protein A2767_02730 [Candidatus Roizmanbacteria bacterium RIFCSPHIGHO2_01_FULL_35_10]|uniref:Uncharacterized protein n=1 Tax=Candidatus Roizmanbacteria bacterium RIFCSPLOWO2_01_FULL_35_13 TaxID=1802055 RepID=A0A1F7IF31_9BACT|nr:MAG: hypothetical protein A2767_02730 [Candidatus Roizmanbacteria bacterium RIFCSPHIGHO2_01_FULL_35_10]OGK41960.1 MAG: hypothetical protein A3A74_04655 [Candidatus Roizmanbacteria bacterium RIFCSPLOWO2_01_FULL_35_13]
MAQSKKSADLSPTVVLLALFIGLGAVGVVVTNNVRTNPTPPPTTIQPTSTLNVPDTGNPEDTSMKQGTFTFDQPTKIPQTPSICTGSNLVYDDEGASNKKSNIFVALDPPTGQRVGANGQIRAWVNDEAGGRVPSSVEVDSNGNVTRHSNPAVEKDSHGYPFEASIYLTRITAANLNGPFAGDKENGGTPVLATAVKGMARGEQQGSFRTLPVHDDPSTYRIASRVGEGNKVAEYIWNVASLNLSPGTFRVQVALHDGDSDLAIECTTIVI